MARVIKRVAAKRDLTDHFVFLGDKASVDVARRFLHACNVSFQALAHMPELGTQRSFRNPRFSSVRAWPVKSFERYLIFYRPLTDGVEILRVIQLRQRHRTPFSLEFPDYSTVRIRGFRHDRAVVFLFSGVVSLIRPGPVSSPRAFAKQSSLRSNLLKSLLHVSNGSL